MKPFATSLGVLKGYMVHDRCVHTCIDSGGGHFEHLLFIKVVCQF